MTFYTILLHKDYLDIHYLSVAKITVETLCFFQIHCHYLSFIVVNVLNMSTE